MSKLVCRQGAFSLVCLDVQNKQNSAKQAPVVQAICLRECRKCFAIDISNLCPLEGDPNAALGGGPGGEGHFGTHGEGPTQVTEGPCGVHGLNHTIPTRPTDVEV